MRFSDHRGLSPAGISFTDGSLTGLLRRTKTTGTDKNVSARPVRVDSSSFISSPQWLSAGWQILSDLAPFQRDYLLPAPAGAYGSCLRTELRYALGHAIQNRLLASLVDGKGAKVLTAEATVFWTPHSGRSFLPSCTQALGFPKEERDFLGGWSPQGSDTYSRTAKLRISSMQKAVSHVIAQGPKEDRLGERESIIQLEEHLTRKGHDTHTVANITKKISEWGVREAAKENAVLLQGNLEDKNEENRGLGSTRASTGEGNRGLIPGGSERPELDSDEAADVDILERPDKRCKAEKIKKLGGAPKQRREQSSATLRPGYYVCESGKTRMRILHQLGACWMVPGVDYFSFVDHGSVAPSPETYTKVCKWCASKATTKESDESDSSSSTILNDS